jgi:streptogramin lyase
MKRILLHLCLSFIVLVPQATGQVRRTTAGGTSQAAGHPTVLASKLKNPAECLVDATDVYWLEAGSRVMRVDKNGGSSVMVASDNKILGYGLDATNVYYLTEKELKRVKKSGGHVVELANNIKNQNLIVVDESSVYWLAHKDGESGVLMKVAKDGGEPMQIASQINYAKGLLVDDKYVYWADYADDSLKRVDKAGGQPEVLAKESDFNLPEKYMSSPEHIAVDQNSIFWACVIGCMVSIDKKSGLAKGVLPEQRFSATRLSVDDTNLYWASTFYNRLMKVNKNGGRPVTLAAGQASPNSIAVDEKYVYWSDDKNGLILKIAK